METESNKDGNEKTVSGHLKRGVIFVPCTPGGSILMNLSADTKQKAWDNLLEDADHMPYDGLQGFKKRGYSIEQI